MRLIKNMRLILILALAMPMCAQTPKPVETPKPPAKSADTPKPPIISDAQRAQFFKAQSQMIQANARAQQQQTEFQNAVAEIQKTCGDSYILQLNSNVDPECVTKLMPAKAK